MSQLYNQIIELRKEINQHNYNYYVLDNPTISDTEFDVKLKELENLENICSTNEKTIDQMVYKLYDLTADEIKIVEGV